MKGVLIGIALLVTSCASYKPLATGPRNFPSSDRSLSLQIGYQTLRNGKHFEIDISSDFSPLLLSYTFYRLPQVLESTGLFQRVVYSDEKATSELELRIQWDSKTNRWKNILFGFTLGFIPKFEAERITLVSVYKNRLTGKSHRFEESRELEVYSHLFLLPYKLMREREIQRETLILDLVHSALFHLYERGAFQ